jgi:hypothetical protein
MEEPASAVVSTPTQPATAEPFDSPAAKKKMAPRPSPKAVDWKKGVFDR